jgi:hypothetical protein
LSSNEFIESNEPPVPRTFGEAALTPTAAEENQDHERNATVPVFSKAPTIDGEIASGEWDLAVRTTGFQGRAYRKTHTFNHLEERKGTT